MGTRLSRQVGALALLTLACCQSDTSAVERPQALDGCAGSAATQACSCADGRTGIRSCFAGAQFECQCGTTAWAGGLPCDVRDVVERKCWTCHGSVPQYTAPMSLVTRDDFMAPSPSNPALLVHQQVGTRVHHATSPMPPPPNARLEAAELATLDRWLQGGAPAATTMSCSTGGPDGDPTHGDPNQPPDGPIDGDPGVDPVDPIDQIPADQECYELVAHGNGSDAPFPIPNGTLDAYTNFSFLAPWDDSTPIQAVSFRAVIDNPQVIHHWLLYQNDGSVTDGAVAPGNGIHGSEELLAGWAPGAPDMVMPDDVGVVLGKGFTVEIHYNNSTGAPQTDASGVQICLTRQLRPHMASMHWLGTESIYSFAGGDVSGTCTPRTDMGPITILRSWPHMHLKGTHFKTVINRQGGGTETLVDNPFDFNTQLAYDTPAQINAGDTLTTTCTYSGPAMYGSGTGAEMCYNFMLAYPAGALSSGGGGFGGVSATSTNRCLE